MTYIFWDHIAEELGRARTLVIDTNETLDDFNNRVVDYEVQLLQERLYLPYRVDLGDEYWGVRQIDIFKRVSLLIDKNVNWSGYWSHFTTPFRLILMFNDAETAVLVKMLL